MPYNPPPKPFGKLALVLQFYPGDRDAAMRNAVRIADNEPEPRVDTEFVFAARFDTTPDPRVVDYVRQKFPETSVFTSSRRETGWPAGPNALWADVMVNCANARFLRSQWIDVKAVLTFEADCVPVQKDWINQLSAEWDVAARKGKFVVGCLMPPPKFGPVGHINGNALFAPDLYQRIPAILGCSPVRGWDAVHAQAFQPHWYPTPLIQNYYRDREVSAEDIERVAPDGRKCVLLHGVKDKSVEDYADKVLGKHKPTSFV